MNKTVRYSHIESIKFTLSAMDIFCLLKDAGHVPEGFSFNPTLTTHDSDFPIYLTVDLAKHTLPSSDGPVPCDHQPCVYAKGHIGDHRPELGETFAGSANLKDQP